MKKILKYIIFVIIILLIVYFVRKLQNNCNDFESINEAIDTEITSKIQEIKDIKDSNCVSIAFMTDLHINNQEERICTNNIKAFTNISNSKLVDLSISGGDLFYATWKNRDEGKVNLKYSKLLFSNINIPMLYVRGNHDCNIKKDPNEAISNEDYYNIMLKQLDGEVIFNEKDPYGGYYYKDIEKQKIRVCVLNAFNGENYEYILGNNQLQFIANNMLDFGDKKDSEDWQVVFFIHTLEDSTAHLESVKDKEDLYKILSAYKSASVVETNNIYKDFSNQKKGTVIAIITGHHHMDTSDYKNGFLIITTRSASVINDRNNTIQEIDNTKNELAFDVFTINTKKKTINITRVGRGENRKFDY